MIKYREGYKYQLAENCTVALQFCPPNNITSEFIDFYTNGVLTVRSGYAWDGASGPTVDTENSMEGALVHDALYQLMRQELLPTSYRENADNELNRICIEKGMSEIRADMWLVAVKELAEYAADPKNKKEVIAIP